MIALYETALTRRRLSPNTIRLRLFYIHKVETVIGDLRTATLDQLETYLNSNPRWAPATRQAAIASIRSFYTWAEKFEGLTPNPTIELIGERVHRTPSRIASDTIITDALTHAPPPERAMILLGAECGLRVSEIAALHRTDRAGEWITIVGKGNVQRSVFVTPELSDTLDHIERHQMRWGFYFPGRSGGHMHPSTVWRHIRDLVGVNPHALRHRAGTVVYRNTGNDLRVAQEFLGHARPETTAIYVHVGRDDLRRAGMAARLAA